MKTTILSTLLLSCCLALTFCGNGDGFRSTDPGTDSDTDSDSDSDTDTDSDVDTETSIDEYYEWHTFYFGEGKGLAEDSSGNIVVVGSATESWQGPGGVDPLNAFVEYYDLCVLKLDSNGAYQWHTFLGDFGPERGQSVVVDGDGNIYVAGKAGASWDGPGGETALYPYNGDHDNFVVKIDPDGAYQWHAFFGAGSSEGLAKMTVDAAGNLLVAGTSTSTWDVVGVGGPISDFSGSNDVYVAKLDSEGSCLWHSFFGGVGSEAVEALAVDAAGRIYVTGMSYNQTGEFWFGPAGQSPVNPEAGEAESFVLKLDTDGAYQWHSYYGSRLDDGGYGVAVDENDDVILTGYTAWPWNGPAADAPLNPHSRTADLFVVKLDSSGGFKWHTFMGGSARDEPADVVTDENGNIFITGDSEVGWTGPGGQGALNAFDAMSDAFILKIGSNGSYKWHSFQGGADQDSGEFIALGSDGSILVAGTSEETWDGPEGESPLNAHSGDSDFFVLKRLDPDSSSDSDTDTDTDTDSDTDWDPDLTDWECHPAYFGSNDGCDCGCGATDPDCTTGGCFESACYDAACEYCHYEQGTSMPCIPPGDGNSCPLGVISLDPFEGNVFCTSSAGCASVPLDYFYVELEFECDDEDLVCCAQFCNS